MEEGDVVDEMVEVWVDQVESRAKWFCLGAGWPDNTGEEG